MRDVLALAEEIVTLRLAHLDPLKELGEELLNLHSARQYDLKAESPAKAWWEADEWHDAIGRALQVDRSQHGGVYALAPFRILKVGDKYVVAAAWPCPRILENLTEDWLGIQDVIAWNPKDNTTEILGEAQPATVGKFDETNPTLFGDTRSFFIAWAQARAAHFQRWLDSRKGKWSHPTPEHDLIPGKLVVGNIDKVRWKPSTLPENFACVGINADRLNRALFKAARLPRAHSVQLKAVA